MRNILPVLHRFQGDAFDFLFRELNKLDRNSRRGSLRKFERVMITQFLIDWSWIMSNLSIKLHKDLIISFFLSNSDNRQTQVKT